MIIPKMFEKWRGPRLFKGFIPAKIELASLP